MCDWVIYVHIRFYSCSISRKDFPTQTPIQQRRNGQSHNWACKLLRGGTKALIMSQNDEKCVSNYYWHHFVFFSLSSPFHPCFYLVVACNNSKGISNASVSEECRYFLLCLSHTMRFVSVSVTCVTYLRGFVTVLMKCVAVLAVRSMFMRWSFMRSLLQREEMKLPHVSDSVQHVVCCPNPSPAPHYQIPITCNPPNLGM